MPYGREGRAGRFNCVDAGAAGVAEGAFDFGAGFGNTGAGFGAAVSVNPCSAASAGGAVSGTSTCTCLVGASFSSGTTFGKFSTGSPWLPCCINFSQNGEAVPAPVSS